MRSAWEVATVAARALAARPGRAALMVAGPLLGVAVIVGAIGVLQSTTGELRQALRQLGTDLIVADVVEGRLPTEAVERAAEISTVRAATGIGTVPDVVTGVTPPSATAAVPPANVVFTAEPGLLDVAELELSWGRTLQPTDEIAATTAAVVGARVAASLRAEGTDIQTVYLNDQPFGIVGALQPSVLVPDLDFAVLIPTATAEDRFGADHRPTRLLVRVIDGTERRTAEALNAAATYGGPGQLTTTIPTDLLAAQTEIDRTLAGAVVGLGLLAMAVGGFGIANVMLISVLERRREIGVRRALGHLRAVIALQFLTETVIVGVAGALLGAALGIGFVATASAAQSWVAVIDARVAIGAIVAAIVVTILAGLHPALRAARLQPLDALRGE